MNGKISKVMNVTLLMALAIVLIGGYASGNTPGGESDPVVTQSYVDPEFCKCLLSS